MAFERLIHHFVATRAQSIFPFGCVWLDGKALVPELARAARRFGWPRDTDPSPEQATAFLRNQLHHSLVLLVVDNLPESPNLAYLPFPGGACRTLVTSRAVNLGHDLAVPTESLHLENWEPPTCRTYLRLVVPRLSTEPDADLDALSIFVHGLPFAIRLIARAFARYRDRTAKAHLARLEAEPLGTLDSHAGPADRSIAATFLEAFGGLGTEERKVLLALAACAQGTRAEIVAAVAGVRDDAASDALNPLADVSLADYRDGTRAPWASTTLFASSCARSRVGERHYCADLRTDGARSAPSMLFDISSSWLRTAVGS